MMPMPDVDSQLNYHYVYCPNCLPLHTISLYRRRLKWFHRLIGRQSRFTGRCTICGIETALLSGPTHPATQSAYPP